MSRIRPKMSESDFIDFLVEKKLGRFVKPELYLITPATLKMFSPANDNVPRMVKMGLTCACCGVVGRFILIDKYTFYTKMIISESFVRMTLDHIIPRSVQKNIANNKQVMCHVCNNAKGNSISHLSEKV